MHDPLALRVHGDVDREELSALGLDAQTLLDVSVNLNPLGPHPDVVAAIRGAAIADYPDRRATDARRAIALDADVDPRSVLVGHGSVELLWNAVQALAQAERPLLIAAPTFSEAEAAARAAGIAVVHVHAPATTAFAPSVADLSQAIEAHAPFAVYLCHPNNPTGRALPLAELRALTAAHPSTTFLLDQAFLSLSERHAEMRERFGAHVVLVRSLTKDHALAGVRAGYALCHPDLGARIEARRPPWMTSTLTQAAIVAALAHPEHVARARALLLPARLQLTASLEKLDCEVVPSETCFVLTRVGNADALRARLLEKHRLLVRSASSFGLPVHVRIAASDPATQARLIAALGQELSQ